MKKNGFTLIELLGVIVLIALISLLSFPSILNHIKKSQDIIDKTTNDLVINATKNYVSDNLNYFPKVEGNVFCLTTSELLSKKYLDKGIIEENEELKNKIVRIKYSTVYKYTVVDNCEGIVIEIPDEEIKEPEYELIFEFDESTNTIKGFKEGIDKSLYSDLVIPSYINGIEVKKIDSNAFTGENLTSLTLSSTVTTIGKNAFSNNSITGELDLSSVKSIGSSAFKNNKITGINLSKTITIINDSTFQNNSIQELNIPSNVTLIGNFAFHSNNLVNLQLNEGLKTIKQSAFVYHELSELTIPGSVCYIGQYAFSSKGKYLKTVEIKEGICTESKNFTYHIFNANYPKVSVYVDLTKEGNKKINWKNVINSSSSANYDFYCDGVNTSKYLGGTIKCIYE